MENALLNLCVNARDAMDGRGRLIIRTGQVQLAHHEVGECAGGEYVTLRVSDDGCGMRSEEHTSELQSLMRISYAVFCLKTKLSTNVTNNIREYCTLCAPNINSH